MNPLLDLIVSAVQHEVAEAHSVYGPEEGRMVEHYLSSCTGVWIAWREANGGQWHVDDVIRPSIRVTTEDGTVLGKCNVIGCTTWEELLTGGDGIVFCHLHSVMVDGPHPGCPTCEDLYEMMKEKT